jgi:mannosyltransferase
LGNQGYVPKLRVTGPNRGAGVRHKFLLSKVVGGISLPKSWHPPLTRWLTSKLKATTFSGLMAGLVLTAFVLRLYHLDYQSLWRDEVDAIRFSSDSFLNLDSLGSILAVLTRAGHNGPLYFILLRGWRALSGDSAFALRYFSLLAGVVMVPLTYQLARRLRLGNMVGGIAALLVATSPYLLWYSQEAKMYTWLACLVLVALYAYQTALQAEKSGPWWLLFVAVTTLSFYLHILAPLMLPVYALWGLIQWPSLKRHWRGWLAAMALLVLPYLPLFLWQSPLWFDDFDSGHPFYSLRELVSLLVHLYSVGILRVKFSPYAMALTASLIVVGLCLSLLTRWRVRGYLQLGAWLVLPPLLVYFISLRVTVFEDRYLIYILPAYYLLVALGLVGLAQRVSRGTQWLAALLLALVLGFNLRSGWLQTNQVIKADFRAAAQYIAANLDSPPPAAAPDVPDPLAAAADPLPFTIYLPLVSHYSPPVIIFQMPYLEYTFDYYFDALYQPLEGLWTNDNRDPAVVAREMATLTAGVKTLWLVVSEEDHWDSRHLTRQWLDDHGQRVDEAHFVYVDVYRYLLPGGGDEADRDE